MTRREGDRSWTPVEAGLLLSLVYLLLLISLAGARIGRTDRPVPAAPALLVASAGDAALVEPTCIGPDTRPRPYAGEPGVEAPLAFGPPVTGAVETVNGTLIQRLCGGVPEAGRAARPPDRRLWVALDAVVNARDPNRAVSRAEWSAGVDAFITRD